MFFQRLFLNILRGSCNQTENAQIRLLLFRECEVRGRRLIFDSGGGGGPGQQFKDEFQELQLMKDMVFGSATLKYSGDNFRIHDFNAEPWKGSYMMTTFMACQKCLTRDL